jgi:hypothetical protein
MKEAIIYTIFIVVAISIVFTIGYNYRGTMDNAEHQIALEGAIVSVDKIKGEITIKLPHEFEIIERAN